MSYQKQNFANGEVLTASQLNYIEDGIVDVESAANTTKAAIDKIIDPTLTLSGKAADAKATGDKIGELKEDVVNNITNPDEYPLSIAEVIIQATMEIGGLSRTDGSETNIPEYVRLADYFAVESGKTYTFANSGDFRICVLCYDSNLVFIKGWNKDGDTTYPYAWIGSGGKLKIPSGASYIRFYCNVSNDLSVVYTISEDQSSKAEFVKQYFKNHGYAIYGDNIDNETMHKLVIEALGQHGNNYNITEIKAPNSNPQEATLCLMNSGNGKMQFVDISSMVYDENNPTVEIVNQVRGGKKLPEFSIRYNDGQGAGRVKKLTVKPDAIPVEFTSEGIKVRRNNEFNNNATDDEIVTINMAKLHDDVETLKTDLGVKRARVYGLKDDIGNSSGQPIAGKKIAYNGDSIAESRITTGNTYNGGAYAKMIADLTGGTYENRAHGGGILASTPGDGGSTPARCVVSDVTNMADDADLICFEGGINDYWRQVPLGDYAESDYSSTLDTTTLCGALESIFRQAKAKWVGKPIVFVITHKIKSTVYVANSAGYTMMQAYEKMVGICKKYAIPYYDAFCESGLNAYDDVQNTNFLTSNSSGTPDGCHPNAEGYERYYVPQLIALFNSVMPRS